LGLDRAMGLRKILWEILTGMDRSPSSKNVTIIDPRRDNYTARIALAPDETILEYSLDHCSLHYCVGWG
jgi:hypothetical protein